MSNVSTMNDEVTSFTNITDKYFKGAYNGIVYGVPAGRKVFLTRIKAYHLAGTLVSQIVKEKGIDPNEGDQQIFATNLAKQILGIKTPTGFTKAGTEEVTELGEDGSTRTVFVDKDNKILKVATKTEESDSDELNKDEEVVELEGNDVNPTVYDNMTDEELIKFAESKEITFPEEKTTLSKKERNKLIGLLSSE